MMMMSCSYLGEDLAAYITADGHILRDKPFSDPKGMMWVWVNQPFSRGSLRITSVDANVDPEIDERMLSDERDLIRLRDGVQRLTAIARHPAMQRIVDRVEFGAPWSQQAYPHSPDEINSQEELDQLILQDAGDVLHICGTCRMGDPSDPRTVVDPNGRVLGLQGLRVCDGSLMPNVTSANTHLTCVMIAEHLADRIRRAR